MARVYNVQVHPIYDGHVNDHKVVHERGFPTEEEALRYVNEYNTPVLTMAVYAGPSSVDWYCSKCYNTGIRKRST